MPQASNWRSPEAYAYLNELTPADLAWEFLRRNPEYIRDYRACSSSWAVKPPLPKRLPVAGVCHFLLDPGVGADRASVVWLPQLDPSAVLLAPAPPHFDARSMSTIVPEFQRRASDGEYWLIGRGPARIAVVLIEGARETEPASGIVPLDVEFPKRMDAMLRLWRFLNGESRLLPRDRLTRLGRERLLLKIPAHGRPARRGTLSGDRAGIACCRPCH
jgi:hypothetical protein